MILNLLINALLLLFGGIFSFFEPVSLADLPVAGPLLSSTLTSAVQIWNTFMETVPYLQFPWTLFLVVVLPFEILLLIAKFILGHRSPANHVS